MLRDHVHEYLEAVEAFRNEERDLFSLPLNHSTPEREAIRLWVEQRVEVAAHRVRDALLAILEVPS